MTNPTHPRGSERGSERRPTVRQIYALAAALAERLGEEFPATAGEASQLIERLRLESGHPAPRLEDTPPRGSKLPRRGIRRSN
jgi:hypothetical protein